MTAAVTIRGLAVEVMGGIDTAAAAAGLYSPWRGRVYADVPWTKAIGSWCTTLVDDVGRGVASDAVVLVPGRTDTDWCQLLLRTADLLCMVRGRLRFPGHRHPAPFPSLVFYYGLNVRRFMEVFEPISNGFDRRDTR